MLVTHCIEQLMYTNLCLMSISNQLSQMNYMCNIDIKVYDNPLLSIYICHVSFIGTYNIMIDRHFVNFTTSSMMMMMMLQKVVNKRIKFCPVYKTLIGLLK